MLFWQMLVSPTADEDMGAAGVKHPTAAGAGVKRQMAAGAEVKTGTTAP